jgi:hypothetical protein
MQQQQQQRKRRQPAARLMLRWVILTVITFQSIIQFDSTTPSSSSSAASSVVDARPNIPQYGGLPRLASIAGQQIRNINLRNDNYNDDRHRHARARRQSLMSKGQFSDDESFATWSSLSLLSSPTLSPSSSPSSSSIIRQLSTTVTTTHQNMITDDDFDDDGDEELPALKASSRPIFSISRRYSTSSVHQYHQPYNRDHASFSCSSGVEQTSLVSSSSTTTTTPKTINKIKYDIRGGAAVARHVVKTMTARRMETLKCVIYCHTKIHCYNICWKKHQHEDDSDHLSSFFFHFEFLPPSSKFSHNQILVRWCSRNSSSLYHQSPRGHQNAVAVIEPGIVDG